MSELKPCPFCGRTPTVDDCGDHWYFVRCKCGIVQDKLYLQKCDAVRRWNTRKTGKIAMDTNVPNTDCISRQAAIDAVGYYSLHSGDKLLFADRALKALPSAQPEIVRCHKCVHWQLDTVRQNSNDAGWWNEAICEQHSRYGNETYEAWTMADWYCADAERRTE